MIIKVVTVDLETGKTADKRTCNFKSSSGQLWLVNHLTFCFNNGKGVQLFNFDDEPLTLELS